MENDGQLTFEDDPLYIKQNRAHKLLEEGSFTLAIQLFENIIDENVDYPGAPDGIRAARFWIGRANKLKKHSNPYDKAKLLLKEWRDFERYMVKNGVKHGRSTAAIQKYIFSDIIESFTRAYNEGVVPDTAILIQIGDCFKKLGNFEKAIEIYEYARSFNQQDPALLSKLGDCYFSIDETSKAKVLFREAFFIDPGLIELDCIDSPFIHMLHDKTIQEIKNPEVSIYWLPVVAELNRAFNVKREPKKGELEKLRSTIQKLEAEYSTNKKRRIYLKPKLINHYFWLIDSLKIVGGSKKEIEESLQRINEIDPEIFSRYME
jgi:tetratricopeptide (TPR) repeat protein